MTLKQKMKKNQFIINYSKKIISEYKNFLGILDNFICYIDYNLNINHLELYNIIEILLKDNPNFLLSDKCIMDNDNIEYFTENYKEVIITHFISNLTFINTKFKIIDKYNINIKDKNKIFDLFIDFCYIRKNHQKIYFDDFNNYMNDKEEKLYLFLWEIAINKLDKYYGFLEYINN